MKLQDLIVEFLKENRLTLTGGALEDNRPRKLLRFVRGSYEYSLVFTNGDPTIHIFKQRTWNKKPYNPVATTHGGPKGKSRDYKRNKITIDLNNKESLKKLLDFL
jgi:hypothetical protein